MELKQISHFKNVINEKSFGSLPSAEAISAYELQNNNGLQLQIINYGATITSLKIPLQNGELVDVVLGFETLQDYLNSYNLESAPYFGATIGRYAGRIGNGEFILNGKKIILAKNNDSHSLHGGNIGFSQKVWSVKSKKVEKNTSITFALFSPDNDENFPGDLSVELTYTLSDINELIIEYKAVATEDTIVNLTHHSYFNLDGHQNNMAEQQLCINSSTTLETNNENIPTGRFLNLSNCAFDFRLPKNCPLQIDNTFLLENKTKLAASLFNKKNKLKMEVYTNQPAVHIYVGGNCFNTIKGKENANYHAQSGICFETQNFPDAPNHDHFPNAVLKKGATYYHKTIYQFQQM